MSVPLTPHDPSEGIFAQTDTRSQGVLIYGPHCHRSMELFFVEAGRCRFLLDDRICDLREGDFVFLPALLQHYTRYPYGACRRTVVFFREGDLGEELPSLTPGGLAFFHTPHIFRISKGHREQISRWLSSMTAEVRIADVRSGPMLRVLLHGLLLLCGRVGTLLNGDSGDIQAASRHMLEAVRFLNEHYAEPVSAADVAAFTGLSTGYLSRLFRQSAGIGLHEYLVSIRLDHAALELLSTDDSIDRIARRCGFSGNNYFKDAFRKKYGKTPRTYRKGG